MLRKAERQQPIDRIRWQDSSEAMYGNLQHCRSEEFDRLIRLFSFIKARLYFMPSVQGPCLVAHLAPLLAPLSPHTATLR